jgi:hypothetical protein
MSRRSKRLTTRIIAVILGLIIPLLLIEIGIRVAYHSLTPGLQVALRFVRITPFTNERLAPLPLWQDDNDYQTVVRPGERGSLQVGSITLQFRISTYAWWGGRVGFRTPQPETGRVDAVAVGDSHTFCFVDDKDCWINILNASAGLNIANFGQPVTGSISHERLYYDFVAKPELKLGQPKLVLWQFYGNDYNDDYGLALMNHTNKTPPPADLLTDFQTPAPYSFDQWLSENSAIYTMFTALSRANSQQNTLFVDPYRVKVGASEMDFGRPYLSASFDMSQARNQEGEQLSHEAILRTRDIVEKNGGKFIILMMPTKEEVYRDLTEPKMGSAALDGLAAPRLRLMDFCKAQNLTCYDMTAVLVAKAKQNVLLFHYDDIHMNPEGNRVFADAVAALLKTEGVLK